MKLKLYVYPGTSLLTDCNVPYIIFVILYFKMDEGDSDGRWQNWQEVANIVNRLG